MPYFEELMKTQSKNNQLSVGAGKCDQVTMALNLHLIGWESSVSFNVIMDYLGNSIENYSMYLMGCKMISVYVTNPVKIHLCCILSPNWSPVTEDIFQRQRILHSSEIWYIQVVIIPAIVFFFMSYNNHHFSFLSIDNSVRLWKKKNLHQWYWHPPS